MVQVEEGLVGCREYIQVVAPDEGVPAGVYAIWRFHGPQEAVDIAAVDNQVHDSLVRVALIEYRPGEVAREASRMVSQLERRAGAGVDAVEMQGQVFKRPRHAAAARTRGSQEIGYGGRAKGIRFVGAGMGYRFAIAA